MTLLGTAELSAMRSTAEEALPGTAIIQSQAYVSDGGGGGSQAWTAAGTEPCRIAPIGGAGEGLTGGRISADAEYVVTLPSDADLTTDSRLIIDSETFNVEAIRDRSWNVSTRVEVVKQVN